MHKIPCIINAFNQLSILRKMIEELVSDPLLDVIVLDNASTLPELLAFYKTAPCRIVYLEQNLGYRAGWTSGLIDEIASNYYIYSDPDLDISSVPHDFLELMIRGHERHGVDCVGLSLEISDVPDGRTGRSVRQCEQSYWRRPTGDGYFRAPVDTTFGLYHKNKRPNGHQNALRTDRPYTARHVPWYYNQDNPPPEDYRYYLATCNRSSSYAVAIRAACAIEAPSIRNFENRRASEPLTIGINGHLYDAIVKSRVLLEQPSKSVRLALTPHCQSLLSFFAQLPAVSEAYIDSHARSRDGNGSRRIGGRGSMKI